MDIKFESDSVEQTMAFGRQIGKKLRGGEIFGLSGPLGSGKTYLVKGIVDGAGNLKQHNIVNSPTFVIVNEYYGRLHIYHIDAYRIKSTREFQMVGFDDFCSPESVVLIEWADKIADALEGTDYVRIDLDFRQNNKRTIIIKNLPEYLFTAS